MIDAIQSTKKGEVRGLPPDAVRAVRPVRFGDGSAKPERFYFVLSLSLSRSLSLCASPLYTTFGTLLGNCTMCPTPHCPPLPAISSLQPLLSFAHQRARRLVSPPLLSHKATARDALKASEDEFAALANAAALYWPLSARAAQLFRALSSAAFVGGAATEPTGRAGKGVESPPPTALYLVRLRPFLGAVAVAVRETRAFIEAATAATGKAIVAVASDDDEAAKPQVVK
jgi:hypothetical protein